MKIQNGFSDQALRELARYILLAANQRGSIIDDQNPATDMTWSSHAINEKMKALLESANLYTDEIAAALSKLTFEVTTIQPTLSNTELNVVYLYSTTGIAPYTQYLRINELQLINLGDTNLSLTEYYKKTETDSRYATITSLNLVADSLVNKVSVSQGTSKYENVMQVNGSGLLEATPYENTDIDWTKVF